MILTLTRVLLVLGVMLGVVLPKSSAALAELGVIRTQTVLICTGHGLAEIELGNEDTPASERPHDEAPCLLVHALDGAVPALATGWLVLAREFEAALPSPAGGSQEKLRTRLARAPPRA